MRSALGRLLGVVLTLALISVVALAALAELANDAAGASRAPRPLLFNPAPSNVHDRAKLAIDRITTGRDVAAAERELARLGGAALPHVLPQLDTLRPAVRGRVGMALAPVAQRMGVADDAALSTPEAAIAFWGRFWRDHAFDFRPQIVKRLVDRLAARPSTLAREDLLHLDTYAVPELVAALGRVRTPEDVQRARRLTLLLAHVLGRGPVVDAQASVQEARKAVRSWRQFSAQEGADFATLDGPRRVTAMFAQTLFGEWVGRLFGVVRAGHERPTALGLAPSTALLSGLSYVAALLCALALSGLWTYIESTGQPRAVRLSRWLSALCVALPAPVLAGWLGTPASPWARSLLAIALAALLGAAVLSRIVLSGLSDLATRTALPIRTVVGGVLRAGPATLPWIATSLLGLELALGVNGAARAALDGLWRGDVTPAMSLALGGALGAAMMAALADTSLRWVEPGQREPALVEVGGSQRRRLIAILLTATVLIGLFGAGWSGSGPDANAGFREVAHGARALLGYGVLAVSVATLAGFGFGALAASGPRVFDALLVRSVEVSAALPAALWAAALAQFAGFGITLALCLGLLRAIDVAWVLRSEMHRRARADQELAMRSLGHYPLSAYYRRRLRPAALPALAVLALTPAWWVAIGSASRLIGSRATAGQPGWEALLTNDPNAEAVPRIAAAILLGLLSFSLLAFVTATPRRVGAVRSSVTPPPPEGQLGGNSS